VCFAGSLTYLSYAVSKFPGSGRPLIVGDDIGLGGDTFPAGTGQARHTIVYFIETLTDETRQIRQSGHKIIEAIEVDTELRAHGITHLEAKEIRTAALH
jgi:hypothetical protein